MQYPLRLTSPLSLHYITINSVAPLHPFVCVYTPGVAHIHSSPCARNLTTTCARNLINPLLSLLLETPTRPHAPALPGPTTALSARNAKASCCAHRRSDDVATLRGRDEEPSAGFVAFALSPVWCTRTCACLLACALVCPARVQPPASMRMRAAYPCSLRVYMHARIADSLSMHASGSGS